MLFDLVAVPAIAVLLFVGAGILEHYSHD